MQQCAMLASKLQFFFPQAQYWNIANMEVHHTVDLVWPSLLNLLLLQKSGKFSSKILTDCKVVQTSNWRLKCTSSKNTLLA